MELDFYNSPFIAPALGTCIGISIYLYKQYRHLGTLLILIGFIGATLTYLPINFCVGLAVLNDDNSEFPNLCNSITPHINGISFAVIGFGILKLAQSLKENVSSTTD